MSFAIPVVLNLISHHHQYSYDYKSLDNPLVYLVIIKFSYSDAVYRQLSYSLITSSMIDLYFISYL